MPFGLGLCIFFWHCCFYWSIFKHDNVGMKSFDVKGEMEPLFIQCHVIGVHFEPVLALCWVHGMAILGLWSHFCGSWGYVVPMLGLCRA